MSAKESCVFCEIIEGTRTSAMVYEGERHVAFLDKFPLNHGHTLVVPRKHYATVFDMPPEEVGELHALVARLAGAVRAATDADGINIGQNNGAAASQIIHHIHVHIIPRYHNDSGRGWPSRKRPSRDELAATSAEVRAAVSRLSKPIEGFGE